VNVGWLIQPSFAPAGRFVLKSKHWERRTALTAEAWRGHGATFRKVDFAGPIRSMFRALIKSGRDTTRWHLSVDESAAFHRTAPIAIDGDVDS
jgi:hypothetical protein